MASWSVKVHGNPAPQGSMTCKAKHVTKPNLQPSNEPDLTRWRALVAKAGRALPVSGLVGPLFVVATHTIARPASVPLRVRAWPMVTGSKGHGDVDKFGRALLDGLAEAGVYGNDAQVCGLMSWKRYPDSPACQWIDPRDHLDRPGVVIRVYPVGAPAELPYERVLAEDER
jgi:Holliday junction resolvase RusA-like endonuclease